MSEPSDPHDFRSDIAPKICFILWEQLLKSHETSIKCQRDSKSS